MSIAIISHPDCLLHEIYPGHPESPERIKVIDNALRNSSMMDSLSFHQAKPATIEQLALVHDPDYVDYIVKSSPKTGHFKLEPDTIMNPHSLRAALLAAGAGIEALDLIMTKQSNQEFKINQVFCNIRPPGHHAEHNRAMGFCLFNNVMLAAAYAIKQYAISKVAIIDFDVHHGNGTQNILQKYPEYLNKSLFCSSFQHPFYPHSELRTDSTNTNMFFIPMPAQTTGVEFRKKVEDLWIPKIAEFSPELILFSAGFDAHYRDPLANLKFTEEDYYWITRRIFEITRESSKGRVISFLEGGYCLEILGSCVVAHLSAMIN